MGFLTMAPLFMAAMSVLPLSHAASSIAQPATVNTASDPLVDWLKGKMCGDDMEVDAVIAAFMDSVKGKICAEGMQVDAGTKPIMDWLKGNVCGEDTDIDPLVDSTIEKICSGEIDVDPLVDGLRGKLCAEDAAVDTGNDPMLSSAKDLLCKGPDAQQRRATVDTGYGPRASFPCQAMLYDKTNWEGKYIWEDFYGGRCTTLPEEWRNRVRSIKIDGADCECRLHHELCTEGDGEELTPFGEPGLKNLAEHSAGGEIVGLSCYQKTTGDPAM